MEMTGLLRICLTNADEVTIRCDGKELDLVTYVLIGGKERNTLELCLEAKPSVGDLARGINKETEGAKEATDGPTE